MTAPTMPDVLRQAADRLPAPTLADVRVAIHHIADPTAGGPAFGDCVFDAFERYEAAAGWPVFRTRDGMAAHLWSAAAALEAALEHARRRQAATECSACGRASSLALCGTCTGSVVTPCRYCNDPAASGWCSDEHRRLDAACETSWRTR